MAIGNIFIEALYWQLTTLIMNFALLFTWWGTSSRGRGSGNILNPEFCIVTVECKSVGVFPTFAKLLPCNPPFLLREAVCVCRSSRLAARIHVVLRLHRVLSLLKPRSWNNSCLANSCGLGCGLARAILEVRVTLFWCCRVEGGEDMRCSVLFAHKSLACSP